VQDIFENKYAHAVHSCATIQPMNTLSKLIQRVGDKSFGESIGKTQRTAQAYRLGTRTPPADVAKVILQVYKGRISYAGIYGKPEY